MAHDSVTWRVFKNPVALWVGGIAAVILELAEPRIRTAIWNASGFLSDPLGRLERTARAAMITVFGARSISEPLIERVGRLHSRIGGVTSSGRAFSAADPALLTWVHATATFSFSGAYSRYVEHLTEAEQDGICAEALPVAQLFGALDVPPNYQAMLDLMQQSSAQLEPSPALREFLRIMQAVPILPSGLHWFQRIVVRAAVDLIPLPIRERVGLNPQDGLRRVEAPLIKLAGAIANRIVLPLSPASQACIRLGLPASYLYR